MKVYKKLFEKIISLENLFAAWDKFKSDKRSKRDVQAFEWNLEENMFQLYRDLRTKQYKHGTYSGFWIHDPKSRHIHKASVRDRVLHHAIFTVLNPIFEPSFISNSFSCRIGKGTHRGVKMLARSISSVGGNGYKPVFVLKCDVRKFFDTIDHFVLIQILDKKIKDADTMWLMREIVDSFDSKSSNLFEHKGVPIGNLTSQLFANVYMNEFDQFIKHTLKVKHYFRYTDDFVIVSNNQKYLDGLIVPINTFLKENLSLILHPNKVFIRKFHQGIDFLGYIILPHHQQLRLKTKKRILNKLQRQIHEHKEGRISYEAVEQSLQSYLGVLSHADAHNFSEHIKNQFWFWLND